MTSSSAAGAKAALAREEVDALFEILSEPRAGGMGSVFEARERATGRRVALKIVTSGAAHYERFALEADILSRLDHPGIVAHVGYGETADGPWLAMEWLEGETLADVLDRGALDVASTLALGRAIAGGLAAAHARDVVHRDLKPSNVFLVGGDPARPKILDFGVARLREGHRDLTLTNQIVGTPGYMAPEQARGVRDVDARADLFSLGCVLFRALTGEPPFDGPDVLAVLAKLASQDPPPVGDLVDDVPEPLERLVVTLLAKSPADRPDGAASVLEELVRITAIVDAGPPIRRPRRGPQNARIECVVLARRPIDDDTPPLDDTGLDALRARIVAAGGKLAILGDGALLVRVDEQPSSEARAEAAARCAGVLSGAAWQVSIASGYTERVPIDVDDAAVPRDHAGPTSTRSAIDRASATLAGAHPGSVRVAGAESAVERAFHRELLRAIRELGTPMELAPTQLAPASVLPPEPSLPAVAPPRRRAALLGGAALAAGAIGIGVIYLLLGSGSGNSRPERPTVSVVPTVPIATATATAPAPDPIETPTASRTAAPARDASTLTSSTSAPPPTLRPTVTGARTATSAPAPAPAPRPTPTASAGPLIREAWD